MIADAERADVATDRWCGIDADDVRDSNVDAGADDVDGGRVDNAWDPCTLQLLQRLLCWMPVVVAVVVASLAPRCCCY